MKALINKWLDRWDKSQAAKWNTQCPEPHQQPTPSISPPITYEEAYNEIYDMYKEAATTNTPAWHRKALHYAFNHLTTDRDNNAIIAGEANSYPIDEMPILIAKIVKRVSERRGEAREAE